MTDKKHSQVARIGFALAGLQAAWKREASFRTEVILGIVIFVFIVARGTPFAYCLMLGLAGAFVLAAELVNTAIETLCDVAHPEQHPLIKVSKDCAAAAVLMVNSAALALLLAVLWMTR
jgi:undecaprenol kinase